MGEASSSPSTSNLVVAGRCFSVDSTAWDALRAIPTCTVTGEAAGTGAAMAVQRTAGDMHSLPVGALRGQLKEQGVLVEKKLVER